MAKNESSILEGLNFGQPQMVPAARPVQREEPVKVEEQVTKTEQEPVKPAIEAVEKNVETVETPVASIQSTYVASFKEKKRETRSVRTTISLTPRVYEHLTRATEAGDIKSANDLINYLLEQYFEG